VQKPILKRKRRVKSYLRNFYNNISVLIHVNHRILRMNNSLQRKIMRRIYYAYVLRMVTQPALLHGFFLLAMLIALTHFVSLGNVIQNMMSADLSNIPTFVVNALMNTEAWTLVILGVCIFTLFSLRFSLMPTHRHLHFVRA
jgi:hypothetical protein